MENQRTETQQEQEQTQMNADTYTKEIDKIKANTVSKEQYKKLQEELNTITVKYAQRDFTEKDDTSAEESTPTEKDLADAAAVAFNTKSEKTNLQQWKDWIKYRDLHIKVRGTDPALQGVNITQADVETCNNVFDVAQQCIDECEDNPQMFNTLLNSRVRDTRIIR